jgi:hypothetical protein
VDLDGRELKVVLDETPMGDFIEIEGDESSVLKALDAAGFSARSLQANRSPEPETMTVSSFSSSRLDTALMAAERRFCCASAKQRAMEGKEAEHPMI